MKIPFTNYDLRLERRSIKLYDKSGNIVDFATWLSSEGNTYKKKSPTMESIYASIAQEFAKVDYKYVKIDKDGNYKEMKGRLLNYLVSERPNELQSKYDFCYTMMYQLCKYGNALAFLERDRNGNVISISAIDVSRYQFGNGYDLGAGNIVMKYKNLDTSMIELVDYRNVVHLRANPNDIFYGEKYSGSGNSDVLIDLVDSTLASLINELRENGTVRGIIQIGGAATGYARGVATRVMAGTEEKISKQEEIIRRIKKTGSGGILVLDAGEEWKSLANPYSTTSTAEVKKYMDLLYQFNGVNGAVIDGTATAEQMEVFFQKTVRPRVEQFVSELNYKIFSKTAITQGHRIEYYRNPFEYVPINVAMDSVYKAKGDLTTNEIRRMVYKIEPVDGGDKLMYNKNFDYATGAKFGGSADGDNTNTDNTSEDGNNNVYDKNLTKEV